MIDNKNIERRSWSEQQDIALKKLYESLRINKWSHIAQQLQNQFGFAGRTGKQCRQRYNNHLDPALCRDSWTFAEEQKLFHLHDEMGNKWAVISQHLGPGRTDNSVKNHYFSRLRKSLRRLNKVIQQKYKKEVRQIQTKVLYKIIEASEEKFKIEPMCDSDLSNYACKLKNKILLSSYQQDEIDNYKDQNQVKQLIFQIVDFNRNYKRKPKKFRKIGGSNTQICQQTNQKTNIIRTMYSNQSQISFNENPASSFFSTFRNKIAESQQQYDSEDDINQNLRKIEVNLFQQKTQKQKIISPIILTCNTVYTKIIEQKIEKEEKAPLRNSQQILQALGLLEDDIPAPHPTLMKKKTSVISSEQQQNQQFKFFDDSEIQNRIMCGPMLTTVKKESMEEGLFH